MAKIKSKKYAVCAKRLPPCNNICPAAEDIQYWISLAKDKKFREAWEVLIQNNPMPAIHGRVCYHPCETRCNRAQYDSTVNIHCMERFLGDMALEENWAMPAGKTNLGRKVLVVGAGPGGLAAAYHLRLLGYEVSIYEALANAGGTMLTGIPAYRLPRNILSGEVNRILSLGINIEYNHKVIDILAEKKHGGFDAVFLAIGAHLGKNVAFPMENPCKVIYAIDFLHEVAFNNPPALGKRVAIYGGGNTAIDVARTAKRLGVPEISIIYYRTREKMSAFDQEVEEALAEGIKFVFLRSIAGLKGNTLSLTVNELDEKGRPKNISATENVTIDTLIFALNQIPDSEFLRQVAEIELQPNGVITVDNTFMTGYKGIFAGGDMIPYDRSVTFAVGHGRQAAQHIDAYLNDTVFCKQPQMEVVHFDKLHIGNVKSPKITQKTLPAAISSKSFDEIVLGSSQDEILSETKRCFSCGNCFACGKCYNACPVKVIAHSELDKKVSSIDVEGCIGCTLCCRLCPCGAIAMVDRK